MKKAVIVGTIAALMLLIAACGSAAPVPVPGSGEKAAVETVTVEKVPDKYADLIGLLEAEDYDGAVALIETMRPAPVVPDIIEVTITTDNFFDYFELKEYVDESMTMYDEAGNVSGLIVINSYVLKEEYTLADVRADDCAVAADISFDYTFYGNPQNVNFTDRTFTPAGDGTEISEVIETTVLGSLVNHGTVIEGLGSTESTWEITLPSFIFSNASVQKLNSVELLSAAGTLYLYDKA